MTIQTAPPSLTALNPWQDVQLQITFKTVDPVDLTEVTLDPDPVDDGCLLQILDAAIRRLTAYRDAFMDAEENDVGSQPPGALPVPWYAWGR